MEILKPKLLCVTVTTNIKSEWANEWSEIGF